MIFVKLQQMDEYWDARNYIEWGDRTDIAGPFLRNYDSYMLAAEYVGSYIA